MKKFIFKSTLFFSICFLILNFILLRYGANIDYFYNKFTTPKVSSMIIGDSRGMQGIQPSIINNELNEEVYELPIFNYSFTVSQAAIGPLYTKSIFKKLDTLTKKGLFIISITPWMLSSLKTNDNTRGEFREKDLPPHNMEFVNINPNYEYLFKNLNYFHFKSLFRKSSTMHKDGWLEENNLPANQDIFKEWKINQQTIFSEIANKNSVSTYRIKSLDTLIKKFKKHGDVFIVRTPISKEMLSLENTFFNTFDKVIEKIASNNKVSYFNFSSVNNDNYKTYDGHHLDKYGGIHFTKDLSKRIVLNNKK